MAKLCSTFVLAAACTIIRDNVSRITINTGTPPTSTLAETTSIGTATASAASFTLGDSSLTGKKLDVIAFTNIPCPTSTGTAGTLCLISTGATGVIYWQTTFAEQLVASTANLINTSTFIIRISDAT
jgi:hypothetical protein